MRTSAVVVCCLVVLSGCSGLTGGGGFPPGTNETHVNETALLEGHRAALDDRSYTVVSTLNSSIDELPDVHSETRVSADGERYHAVVTRGDTTSELYIANGTVYRRVETSEGVVYRVFEPGPGGPPANGTTTKPTGLERLAQPPDANYTFVRRESGLLGPTVFVFRADGARVLDDAPAVEGEGNFTATLRVTGDGLVRSYESHTPLEDGGVNGSIRVESVGSTDVPEPDWLDEARANATTSG